MEQIFDKEKIQLAKSMLINSPFKRNKFSSIFDLFKDDILKLISLRMPYKAILVNLSDELNSDINYDTFLKWIQKNIKQKNQSSNNTLRKNTQKQKDEIKKEETTDKTDKDKIKVHTNTTPKKEEDDDKPWWKKRVEELSEGMKKAGVRR